MNALVLMVVTLSGIVIDVNPEPANAYSPMNFTLLGMVIVVSASHPENVSVPILVIPSGIEIDGSAEQLWNV